MCCGIKSLLLSPDLVFETDMVKLISWWLQWLDSKWYDLQFEYMYVRGRSFRLNKLAIFVTAGVVIKDVFGGLVLNSL